MSKKQLSRHLVNPRVVCKPYGPWSQAAVVDGERLMFISGQVPVDEDGRLVGEGNFEKQVVKVFESLKVVLASQQATFKEVVKLNIYMTDMANRAKLNEVRSKYLKDAGFPATTTIAVTSLADPRYMVEIEAIAVLK